MTDTTGFRRAARRWRVLWWTARHGRLAPACLAAGALIACGAVGAPAERSFAHLRSLDRLPAAGVQAGAGAADVPVTIGDDRLRVLPGGRSAFPVIADVVANARRTLHVEVYEFGRSDIAGALVAAHDRGVDVQVIDDASVDVSAVTADRLRAAGIAVTDYPIRSEMIDHVKLLVADGDTAVVGGINWGVASSRNHDFDALVAGPAAANLDRVFERDLVTAGRPVRVPEPLPDRGVLVAATLPQSDIRPLALQVIEEARSSLDLELYVLTDVGIVHALERARRRGVVVRVLLDPSERPSDPSAAALRADGVDVRLYRSRAGELLHAKAVVADRRRVLFGSANWTSGGFERNHEVDIEIVDCPAAAAVFAAAAEADWTASS